MATHGKVVHSPAKKSQSSTDDLYTTPSPSLDETSLPLQLAQHIDPSQPNESKIEGPSATSTQKPDERLETSVWERPASSPSDEGGPNTRSGALAVDSEKGLQHAIEGAKMQDPAIIMKSMARIFQASVDEAVKSRKAKSDSHHIAMAIGAIVNQLLHVGELATTNAAELVNVDNLADRLSKLAGQHNSLVDRVYREDPMSRSKEKEHAKLLSDVKEVFTILDANPQKFKLLEDKIATLEMRDITRGEEIDRLRRDLSATKATAKAEREVALQKQTMMQNQIDTILSRIAASATEHAKQLADARAEIARLEGVNLHTPAPQPGEVERGNDGRAVAGTAQGGAGHVCVACKAVFPTAKDLRSHADRYHRNAEEYPIMCNYCPSRFRDVPAQMSHMVAKHGEMATIMPSGSTARLHHLSYIIPGIKMPVTITDLAKIEAEEKRQVMAKIKQVRPDFDAIHIQHWRRLTPDNGVVHGAEYQMMVIFYEELHRQMLHQSNMAAGGSLLPYVDSRQIAHAKQQAEQGMAPFLGSTSGVQQSAGLPATTPPPQVVPHVPQPGLLRQPGRTDGGMEHVRGDAGPVPVTTRPSLLTPMHTAPLLQPQPVRPFFHAPPPPPARQGRQGGRGRGGQIWQGRQH